MPEGEKYRTELLTAGSWLIGRGTIHVEVAANANGSHLEKYYW
jgi:hypothetical protein